MFFTRSFSLFLVLYEHINVVTAAPSIDMGQGEDTFYSLLALLGIMIYIPTTSVSLNKQLPPVSMAYECYLTWGVNKARRLTVLRSHTHSSFLLFNGGNDRVESFAQCSVPSSDGYDRIVCDYLER